MSYVDQPERPQRSFPERLQDVWDHPTPGSLFATIKFLMDAAQSVPHLMNSSAVLTGPAPSTEEEAFRYNQARDYSPRAAFDVARAFGPMAPKMSRGLAAPPPGGSSFPAADPPAPSGGLLGRDIGAEIPSLTSSPRSNSSRLYVSPQREPAIGLPPGVSPSGPAQQAALARAFLPEDRSSSREALPQVRAPSIVPNLDDLWFGPMPSKFDGAARSITPSNGLPAVAVGSESSPRVYDQSYRQLTRVFPASQDASAGKPDPYEKPKRILNAPSVVPEQQPPARELDPNSCEMGSGNHGGDNGSGSNNNGGEPDRNGYCDARKDIEIERCDVRSQKRRQWPNVRKCIQRAIIRGDLCMRNGGIPSLDEREEWGIDDEHQIKSDKRFMERQALKNAGARTVRGKKGRGS